MADIAETLQAALEHHRAGRLVDAELLYRQVLDIHPRHAGAAHLLGLIAFQVGKHKLAAHYIEMAVEFDAHRALYRADLGEVYRAMNRPDEAIATYRKALELNPRAASAHTNLGTLLEAQGQHDEALRCFRRALELDSRHAEAHAAIGGALLAAGQTAEAQAALEQAAQLAPQNADICFKLGRCLHAQGKLLEAIACYQNVARLRPEAHAAHYQLGCAYRTRGQLDHAAGHFTKAAALAPQLAETHYNLAVVRREQGRVDEALAGFAKAAACDPQKVDAQLSLSNLYLLCERPDEAAATARRAGELQPDSASAAAHLARALQLQGDTAGAIAALRRTVELDPTDVAMHSNLLYQLNADPAVDARTLAVEHRNWAARHAEPLTAAAPPHTRRDAGQRRLRVGYVSPYFHEHAVSFFSLPLIEAHDRAAVEVFCYSDAAREDAISERFRQASDHWRAIRGQADDKVAGQVRADEIDVLVDLSGHIGENRLLMFAGKPAPVQVTYLGYQNTTGMSAMDYRFTDAHADPPGTTDALYAERLVRLPRSFFCYAPAQPSPAPGELPALAAGHVTFGWLNNAMKLVPEALETWAQILTGTPNSRLLVLAYRSDVFANRVRESMARLGIDPARLEIVHRCGHDDYLRLHQRIDVALDSFPWNGHTTICDALWMGVPSVVREGAMYSARYGGTALVNLGLDALIARSNEDYVRIACGLAADLPQLAQMRGRLRGQMIESPLMDAAGFARNVEEAYRQMWQVWCRRG